jgi:hypothetical protein
MFRANAHRDIAAQSGWAVLMARIVDRSGVCLHPADVVAIEYTLRKFHPYWPNFCDVVAGQSGLPLDVDQVLFDELQVDDVWAVDAMGYNFRHAIDLRHTRRFSETYYEARYEITLAGGQRAVIRFQLDSSVRGTDTEASSMQPYFRQKAFKFQHPAEGEQS